MKNYLIKLILFFVIFLNFISTAQATWPALAWAAIREIAIDTAIDAVQDLFKDQVKPEDLEALKQRLSKLEIQLAAAEKQRHYPSLAELQTVKQLVNQVNEIIEVMGNRLNSIEQRLNSLEQTVAQLRQTLLALPKETLTDPFDKSLDFQINYLYRPQGQGDFKPITPQSVLHSGDYYKIIFTPTEDCYVYIFQVDSAHKLFRLFPIQGFQGVIVNHRNPVKSGQTYYVPSQHQSFELDEQTGPETIYFVATRHNDKVLESQYQALSLAEQQNNGLKTQHIQSQLVTTLRESKGPKQRVMDDPVKTTWQEDGKHFSVLQQHLEAMCNGCVDVLTFQHQ